MTNARHPLSQAVAAASPEPDTPADPGGATGARPAAGHGSAPIAVVGLACRLPGAPGPAALWELLADGREAVGEPPADRWHMTAGARPAGHPERAGYLERIDTFDARFFGIAPREAAAMDPQQRLLLELAWEAAEDARTDPTRLRDRPTAVYAAAIWQDYADLTHQGGAAPGHHTFTGLQRSILANRISYALGLTGPSLTVDTGQSSSLVAVHLACEELRRGDSQAALVGGVNLIAAPSSTRTSQALGALSPDGRCHTFDARANGYVRGEGGVVLLLKTEQTARADGDRIYCLIEGSAVNNDGGGESLTTPHGHAQEEVVRRAHARAGSAADHPQYVELHGTGTPVGDPVEAAALGAALGRPGTGRRPLAVGSIKTNIGHLEGAAGIAGLLKTVLSLHHRQLPPSLHHHTPNPRIPLSELGLAVRTEHGPWPEPHRRLVAGVSSFGVGGTNCHVVVGECPPRTPSAPPAPPGQTATGAPVPWVLSGHGPAALAAQADRLRRHLADHPETPLTDIAHSLATTRAALRHRAVLIGHDRATLLAGLTTLADGADAATDPEPPAGLLRGVARAGAPGPVLIFPGQGAQWVGMARELTEQSAVFAAAMGRCAAALAPLTDWDFGTELAGPLDRVDVVQPLSWAVMVSLAELWRSFGVVPAAVVGHSQGEIAAAVVCGALSLADGARVVAVRSQLIRQRLAGQGGMLSVNIGRQETADRLAPWADDLCIAAHNGPYATVVAGEVTALDAFADACERDAIRARRVPVDYASHAPQVEPLRADLCSALAAVRPGPAQIPFHSTVVGHPVPGETLDAAYWARNLRNEVRFAPVIDALVAAGHTLFIEASAHPVVSLSVQQSAEEAGAAVAAVGSLRRDDGGIARFTAALAEAYAQGATVDWTPLLPGARTVDLPGYAFQRESYWLTPGPGPGDAAPYTSTTLVIVPETADHHRARPAEPQPAAPGGTPLVRAVAQRPPEERERALLDLVGDEMAQVLGFRGRADVDVELTFREAGFDSASSVEFRNRINAATGLALPTTVLFRYPTPTGLVRHLADELFPAGTPHPALADALPAPLRPAAEHLAAALDTAPLDAAERARAADWLRTLLASVEPAQGDGSGQRSQPSPDGRGTAAGPDAARGDGEDIATATDSEMFALIEKELGIG
ncbi:type I polyketide synthase [Streptomyces sp. 796.1]|uniref:type I polyketide synthase n=1 Tax=Streptomyces sp. 796.1 TaxID=3163029 RepID=UPI0039C8F65D